MHNASGWVGFIVWLDGGLRAQLILRGAHRK
jgi:hypothetical protein